MITPELVAALRQSAEQLLPDTVEILSDDSEENELGEPGTGYVVVGTCAGRLGAETTTSPFSAGRPVGTEDLVLTVSVSADTTGHPAFRLPDGVVYERRGPDENGGNSLQTVRRIPVRRTDLSAPPTVSEDE